MGKLDSRLTPFKVPAACPNFESPNLRVVRLTAHPKEGQKVSVDLYCATCAHRWHVTSGGESSSSSA